MKSEHIFKQIDGKTIQSEQNELLEKDFRTVSLLLDRLEVSHEFRVHTGAFEEFSFITQIGMNAEEREKDNNAVKPFLHIKADPLIVRRIKGRTSQRSPNNNRHIHELVKEEDGSFRLSQTANSFDNMGILITSYENCEPQKTEQYPNGAYFGSVRNQDFGEDGLSFYCIIPSSHMDNLLALLSSNPNVPVLVNLDVLSYGVRDTINIFVEVGNTALVSSIHANYTVQSSMASKSGKIKKILQDDFKENKWPIIIFLVFIIIYRIFFK